MASQSTALEEVTNQSGHDIQLPSALQFPSILCLFLHPCKSHERQPVFPAYAQPVGKVLSTLNTAVVLPARILFSEHFAAFVNVGSSS